MNYALTAHVRRISYNQYQLYWMINHHHTFSELVGEITAYIEDYDDCKNLPEIFIEWERNRGFGGEIWPCFDEFMECEYLDKTIITGIIPVEFQAAYLNDVENIMHERGLIN